MSETVTTKRGPGRPKSTRPLKDKPFLFLSDDDLLTKVREIAYQEDITMSGFIRQAIRKHIKTYENRKELMENS